ncbi:hypothetical protein [Rhodomicrobium lacus]|uniref:hypothetical protein n=1 Tax=Rhodomicrobium lacus TaxID=2498452 RepID=UPI0026E3A8E1|nr:hypothetical protein [Rhodomicrobium lacus]WKW51765.1 hypothetical protein QMO75_04580 [Rhodomicrobium lacus]
MAASILTLLAIALPSVARHSPSDIGKKCQPDETAWCSWPLGRLSLDGSGRVLRTMEAEETARYLRSTANCLKEDISADYIALTRVVVGQERRTPATESAVVAVPNGMTAPVVGDFVQYQGAFTDPKLPCHYTPPVITHLERSVRPPAAH